MIKKDSSENVICMTCRKPAVDGSEYCKECIKAGREKLGLFIPDLFEEFETLRGGIDYAADVIAGADK